MIRPYLILTIALTALLESCAADYQPIQSLGGFPLSGYKDTRIDANTAVVSFDGNRFTSEDKLREYLLYRCAEVTIDNGYDYFIIISSNTSSLYTRVRTKEVNHYSTIPPKVYPVVYRTIDYRSAKSKPSDIQLGPCTLHNTCAVSAVIKMFKGQEPNLRNAYDAKDVIGRLGSETF